MRNGLINSCRLTVKTAVCKGMLSFLEQIQAVIAEHLETNNQPVNEVSPRHYACYFNEKVQSCSNVGHWGLQSHDDAAL